MFFGGSKSGEGEYQPPMSSPGAGMPVSWRKGLRRESSLSPMKRAWFCWNRTSMGPTTSSMSL